MIAPIQFIGPKTVKHWLENNEAVLIDVRSDAEYSLEHIGESSHLPVDSISIDKILDISNCKKIVFHCAHGVRSVKVCEYYIEGTGLNNAYVMKGDLQGWKNEGYKTVVGIKND